MKPAGWPLQVDAAVIYELALKGISLVPLLAPLEKRGGRAEDEVGGALDIASVEETERIVVHLLAVAVAHAVEVERILVAEEAAADEAQVGARALRDVRPRTSQPSPPK